MSIRFPMTNDALSVPRLSDKRIFEEKIVEKRSRRDSDKCIVKLTGAVPLLAEPNCIKHPRCVVAYGGMGGMEVRKASFDGTTNNLMLVMYRTEKCSCSLFLLAGLEWSTIIWMIRFDCFVEVTSV